ncbi:unnamed protein product [Sphenostylis stenocarpa]|uniref:Uncharacterized protein n=1 Tax=Sphenostylis stenocarpa TaxID=92480 RepID=A0AA86VK18_9FABA|nr:unnamed protein product [Sphenostylis stenocarpa]
MEIKGVLKENDGLRKLSSSFDISSLSNHALEWGSCKTLNSFNKVLMELGCPTKAWKFRFVVLPHTCLTIFHFPGLHLFTYVRLRHRLKLKANNKSGFTPSTLQHFNVNAAEVATSTSLWPMTFHDIELKGFPKPKACIALKFIKVEQIGEETESLGEKWGFQSCLENFFMRRHKQCLSMALRAKMLMQLGKPFSRQYMDKEKA